jgi:hypothetical protein
MPRLPPTGTPAATGREPPLPSALFEPPTGEATPDVLFGAWAELDDGYAVPEGTGKPERRLFLGKGSVVLAVRCNPFGTTGPSGIASVRATARVDATTKVTILESKADTQPIVGPQGRASCSTTVAPIDIPDCDAQPGKMPTGAACFRLSGTSLVVQGNTTLGGSWMKLED